MCAESTNKKTRRFFDTCYLLDMSIDELESITDKPYIAEHTLVELGDIKENKNKDDTIKAKARVVARFLNTHEDVFDIAYTPNDCNKKSISGDEIICHTAKTVEQITGENITFYTNDYLCRIIARDVFHINVAPYIDKEDTLYKGYRKIVGTSGYITELMLSYQNNNYSDWYTNEYLIIENTDDGSEREMRFDGEKFVALKLPPSKYIKGRNSLQRCALDMLCNPEISICAILGGYGSGKTMLTMQMALYAVQEKGFQSQIVGIRSPVGEGVEIGWLPGDFDDKTGSFFKPLEQQLNGGEFELESLKQRGVLRTEIPFYLKGQTLNGIILVDEAEDLTKSSLRLVGTRVGENSRIFLNGDYKQSVVNGDECDNALLQMCNEFRGNKNFGCIYLEEDVRSKTSKMFASLWNK